MSEVQQVKRFMPWVGFVISMSCMAFFIASTAPHWKAISTTDWDARVWALVILALCFYLATYASATLAWKLSLRILGQSAGYAKLARVLLLSQFAKYLPGNVGHHIGRVVLAKRVGLRVEPVIASMAIDIMILLVAAAICSLPAFALTQSFIGKYGVGHGRVAVWLVMMAVLVLVALAIVPATRRIIVRHSRFIAQHCDLKQFPLFAKAGLVHCFAFIFGATALYLLCSAFAGAFNATWLSILGVYTAAWLLGFVMPGAPAGLGVRELALLVGLSPIYGEQQAMAAAAILRLVTTSGDGIVFLFALLRWGKLNPSPSS